MLRGLIFCTDGNYMFVCDLKRVIRVPRIVSLKHGSSNFYCWPILVRLLVDCWVVKKENPKQIDGEENTQVSTRFRSSHRVENHWSEVLEDKKKNSRKRDLAKSLYVRFDNTFRKMPVGRVGNKSCIFSLLL